MFALCCPVEAVHFTLDQGRTRWLMSRTKVQADFLIGSGPNSCHQFGEGESDQKALGLALAGPLVSLAPVSQRNRAPLFCNPKWQCLICYSRCFPLSFFSFFGLGGCYTETTKLSSWRKSLGVESAESLTQPKPAELLP